MGRGNQFTVAKLLKCLNNFQRFFIGFHAVIDTRKQMRVNVCF